MQTRACLDQEIIYREGDFAGFCYVVQSGIVHLVRGLDGKPTPVQAGECFGEIAILEENARYSNSAQSIGPATLLAMTMPEFHNYIHQCPPVLLPMLERSFEALKMVATQEPGALRAKTEETALPDIKVEGINKVSLRSGSDAMQSVITHPLEVMLSRLPYKIGGFPENGEVSSVDNNNLFIPCKAPPLAISRQHCQIELVDDHLELLDLGSRFNTVVNDVAIGRGRGGYKAVLGLGDNKVRLGGYDSPYTIIIRIE